MSNPTKVYIAAPYCQRADAVEMMAALEGYGIEVTSSWLRQEDALADEFARLDLADVARADVLLAMNLSAWKGLGAGGRHVEFGYAIALGKKLVHVGAPTNLFHYLSSVDVVPEPATVADVVQAIQRPQLFRFISRENAVGYVIAEVTRAESRHAPMNSPHEAWAVIREEVDELWDEVKADRGRWQEGLKEAAQVAAMGLRYVRDLAPKEEPC